MAAETTGKIAPQRTTRWVLVLFLVGICSRGYGYYDQTLRATPQVWMDVVHGTANAPDQYRIGVVFAANWMTQHVSWHGDFMRLSQAFGAFDLVGSVVAVLLLYELLVRTSTFERASVALQWFGSASFVALTLYLVDWTNWYQKVSTLPSAGLLAAMLWAWTPPRVGARSTGSQEALRAMVFALLVVALSLIRADIAVCVCIGIFVASLTGVSRRLALRRSLALAVSSTGALAAIAIQLYLMKVRYPYATYGGIHAVMIAHDWWRWKRWAYFILFTVPFFWTLAETWRRRDASEGAAGAFLIAAAAHAILWVIFGRLDEVRIFLPMALVTLPLTVEMAMHMVQGAAIGGHPTA